MSDYRRFVSYIYLYENNIKSMNAGFVKVESRNGLCRFSLSLKNVYSGTGACKVYGFVRVGQELRGIYLGDAQARNHGCDWVFQTETERIGGSCYRLEQMSGMIIHSEGGKFYGTRWDHGDLELQRFVTEWDDIDTSEKNKESAEDIEDEEKETMYIEPTVVAVSEKESEAFDANLDGRSQYFAKLIEQCPGMYPFEDDMVENCVRLEPQDIGSMPLDCWSYGNNSFLLHGYYSYRHLILARLKCPSDAGQTQTSGNYILGVPGTRHSRDAFMANMFGFREFKPIREGMESPKDFGYWYTIL